MPDYIKREVYQDVSLIYNHLMRKVRYDFWADYIIDLNFEYLTKNPKVLELGSGNCKLAESLRKIYPKYIATDISFDMLSLRRDKKLKKVCCDMIQLPFKSKFDFILSTFDSINYLTSYKKLLAFFKEAYRILNENGILTFDASMERNSINHINAQVQKGKLKNIEYIHRSIYDIDTRIHKNIFEFSFPNGEKHMEIHKQKIYKFEDYFEYINKAGLYVIDCVEAFTFDEGSANSKRVQFIVKKAS